MVLKTGTNSRGDQREDWAEPMLNEYKSGGDSKRSGDDGRAV